MKLLFHKYAIVTVRILLGLNMLISGFLILFDFIALPPANPKADAFISALITSGYLFKLVKLVEVLAGLALILNRFTPLFLVVLFPITLNIFLFDTISWPAGAPAGAFVMSANLFLLFAYFKYYKPLLVMKPDLTLSN